MSRAKHNAVAISCAIDWENVPLATRSEAEVQAWIKRTRGIDIDIETIRHRKSIMGLRLEPLRNHRAAEIRVKEESPGEWIACWRWRGEQMKARGTSAEGARMRAEERLERLKKGDRRHLPASLVEGGQ